MDRSEIRLITVSREFGAGGSELAAEIGAQLQWPVLDQDIVERVAERLRLDKGTVERFDEHPPSLLTRIATVLIIPQPDMYSFPPAADMPGHDDIAHATREVIEDAGASPPIVIVGHGAQCIFAGRNDALHIRVIAPLGARIARTIARMHVTPSEAGTILQRADQDRQTYVQRHFHRDWRNELLYDVQFNTGTVSISDSAAMIADLVNRTGVGQPASVRR